jgi:ERCC4-related helicase
LGSSLEKLNFIYTWRTYQSRVLNNFEKYIEDHHFHIIAPPGSGKTILGIELVKRIHKKTLILSPTLAIRNQWESRLQQFFAEDETFESVSFDINDPAEITFITYQSLHAFYKTFETDESYSAYFKTKGIDVFVLDEAHHLKNAWWQCLMTLKNNDSYTIVALTATPPYDSEQVEISKYFALCGEIDEEISVPELVRETDLCPHQDYVYLSKPEGLEIDFIFDFRRKAAGFLESLVIDEEFVAFIKTHRFLNNTSDCLDELYSNTAYFSSILIFLNATGYTIPKEKLMVLGFSKTETIEFPELSLEWVTVLLQNLLVTDRVQLYKDETYVFSLGKRLKKLHLYDNKNVNFTGDQSIYRSLTNSSSKLKSIVKIVNFEYSNLKNQLRCVVLTDYIRKEFLNTTPETFSEINKIGVIPIFHFIKQTFPETPSIAVLTGSIVIIHDSILESFKSYAGDQLFSFSPLNSNFLRVTGSSVYQKSIIDIITRLFEAGIIKVLIGTKSLLGEGWDAPSINSLVLASFVGSFVSSNQMRGRAIRKQQDKPHKTGNIWHLACIDPTLDTGGHDVDVLRRRFETFLGVSNTNYPFIENGMERIEFPEYIFEEEVDTLNAKTLKLASNRNAVTQKWQSAIGNGMKLGKKIRFNYLDKVPFKAKKKTYFLDIIKFVFLELTFSMSLFFLEFIVSNIQVVINKGLLFFIYILLASFTASFGVKLYKAIKLYIKHGFLYKEIHKFGEVILATLHELKYLNSAIETLSVESFLEEDGAVFCGLIGATQLEEALFNKALSELLAPIESPRYLIIKKSIFRKALDIENFYPVPELFGDLKKKALIFQKHWEVFVGRSKLVYTRQNEGRKLLLKARLHHISASFLKTTRAVSIWK